jgi:hypothetical protein
MALASVTGMGCLYSCCYRSRLRGQYALKEKPCADCCVHWFCEPCALCQEYRELKNRGYDMSIGMRTSPYILSNRLRAGRGSVLTSVCSCRVAGQHGEDGEDRCDRRASDEPRDDSLE